MTRVPPSDQQLAKVRWPLRSAVSGKESGGWRSTGVGEGMEMATVREYTIGDDPRRINWTATARTGSLHVVVPIAERSLSSVVAVDTTGSMATGSVRTKIETALEVVDTVSKVACRHSDRFELLVAGDSIRRTPIRQGKSALKNAQSILETVVASGEGRFSESILQSLRNRPGLLIAVSDWRLDSDREALKRCSELVETIAIRVVDPTERDLPNAGLITLQNPETGRQMLLDTGDPKVRELFSEAARDLDADFRSKSRLCRMVIEITTAGDHGGAQVLDQLLLNTRRRR